MVALVVNHHWPQRRVAERFNVSPATVNRWVTRHNAGDGFEDHSSRPARCPHQLDRRRERRIIKLRVTHRWGPHRIGYRLGIARSTVGRVLDRYNMPGVGLHRPGHRPAGP
jgi:transposase